MTLARTLRLHRFGRSQTYDTSGVWLIVRRDRHVDRGAGDDGRRGHRDGGRHSLPAVRAALRRPRFAVVEDPAAGRADRGVRLRAAPRRRDRNPSSCSRSTVSGSACSTRGCAFLSAWTPTPSPGSSPRCRTATTWRAPMMRRRQTSDGDGSAAGRRPWRRGRLASLLLLLADLRGGAVGGRGRQLARLPARPWQGGRGGPGRSSGRVWRQRLEAAVAGRRGAGPGTSDPGRDGGPAPGARGQAGRRRARSPDCRAAWWR